MQNFYDGGNGDHQHQDDEKRRLDNRSDEITHNLNLDDSFNESNKAHDYKVQAQVDRNTQYRHELKQQCDDDNRRTQYQYEESRVEMRKMQDFERNKVSEDESLTERARQMQVKDKLNDKMCSELLADEEDRQDREHELDVKHGDERHARHLQEDVDAQDKFDEDRKDLRDGLLSQIEENKQSVRDEKQRDQMFSDQATAIMEAEDEREKVRARQKKEADDQHYASLRQQIVDNAERRLRQKQLDSQP